MMAVAPARHEPAWYTPARMPPELEVLAEPIDGGLPVGSPGKVGLLEVGLSVRGEVTRMTRQYQRAPLHVYQPIYLDAALPGMPFIFVQQSGDGLVQGDRYRIDIECEAGAAAHITTQAATNVFVARQDFATQLVNLHAGEGAVLEYLPDPVVPFHGSRLFQRSCVTVEPGSTVILCETLLPGRVAHGEAHAYDLYWSETEVRDRDGELLFADVLRLGPAVAAEPQSTVLLDRHQVLSSVYVISWRLRPDRLVACLREALAACRDVLAGVSELPNGCGAGVRLLGPSSQSARTATRTTWDAARRALLGVGAPDLRKGWSVPKR
jgi:urease accessory protein